MESLNVMSKVNCHRKGCTRIRSEFGLFLSRRQPPRFEGYNFCSEACLQDHVQSEIADRWYGRQQPKCHSIHRPKLGSILLQTAFVTPAQLETALELQRVNREGRVGEWLLRLGFIEERQITHALSKQYGLPIIHLDKSDPKSNTIGMIPGKVALCSKLLPLRIDEEKNALCLAVSSPEYFSSQEAIRRMVGKKLIAYICDQSTVLSLIERWYEPEDLKLTGDPSYNSQGELSDIVRNILSSALIQRAENIRMELTGEFLWARLDFQGRSAQQVYHHAKAPASIQTSHDETRLAVASMGRH